MASLCPCQSRDLYRELSGSNIDKSLGVSNVTSITGDTIIIFIDNIGLTLPRAAQSAGAREQK